MNIIQALLLGLIQGLTEFLPVSSSAHLVVFQSLFKLREPMLFFDVMLHLGTLMSVLIFFRADIYRLVGALAGRAPADARRWPGSVADGRRVALWVILGSVPAGIVGALFNDIIEKAFSSPVFTGIALFVTGTILIGADRARRGSRATADLSAFGALAVGAAQALAILPGISRSGSTISASIFLGLDRREAARFSFFLAIPAILGAAVFELKDAIAAGVTDVPLVAAGAAVAFVSGLLALKWLISVLTKGRLMWFSIYCYAFGAFAIVSAILLK